MIDVYDLYIYKEQNKHHKIIYVLFENHEFVFRTLTRKEYKDILALTSNDSEMEEIICDISCLYPKGYDFVNTPIGALPEQVAPLVLDESGFVHIDKLMQLFEQGKREMNSFDMKCMCFIKTAFPEYEFDDLENWTFERLIKTASKAEFVLQMKGYNVCLTQNSEAVLEEQEENENLTTNTDFINELDKNGIDPMEYFKNDIISDMKVTYIEEPFIGSLYWEDEGVLNGIQRQMENRKNTI